ncbi:hypothetical protein OIU34_23400 [Pararhizobium sp. BT-229]|uniref:hypothetical protein n=1 Tax=Pararhizobium sp. BT-229 TaxID=2986923 RepID=UPI0021F72D7C|nr:hypothetical protein [Pararhizobium sp. BT-229]MCV9964843.1 hypothetical protein [Pararhizobium sp. BT-229]
MPFVHSIFTFRKPSNTAKLNDVLQRLEVRPGSSAAGEPIGRDYLDQFKTGAEVSFSLISPTGVAARVHSVLLTGLIEAAGETVEVSSAVIVEPDQQPEAGAAANSMMSRIQMWGRTNRVGNQRVALFELAPPQDIAAAGVIFDEETVIKAEDANAPPPSGPKF